MYLINKLNLIRKSATIISVKHKFVEFKFNLTIFLSLKTNICLAFKNLIKAQMSQLIPNK